ncbi:Hypothetical protein CAP_2051 [Chondromyces apiculatus DSM 436]|uniref:Uncharacterized protein n=1 Tax=Chondromyces apiculatus DSM 436 TaxID=1192034 RepID=A0A017SSK8_9BACT|nr:Hypothetical protein CAP_2051 [Chondromyces apiculatus DSM 436]
MAEPEVTEEALEAGAEAPDAQAEASEVRTEVLETLEARKVALDELVPTPSEPLPPPVAIRTARVVWMAGRRAKVELRGMSTAIDASIAPEVDPGVITDAVENGDAVLVETAPEMVPVIVGVLHTRRPRELKLKAGSIQIEGDEEVLLRAGRAAIRIRADGDVEVVGGRISASSRGLFRIVGRILRLN